jgi:hypothetical protein
LGYHLGMKKRWLLVLLTVLPAASRAAAPAGSTSLERRLHVSSAESSSYLILPRCTAR